jgi:hypothetical protein
MGTLYAPAWSSRDLLVLANDDDYPDCTGGGEISSTLRDGSSYRRMVVVDSDDENIHPLDFSPEGDAIVFERGIGGGAEPDLTRATLALERPVGDRPHLRGPRRHRPRAGVVA